MNIFIWDMYMLFNVCCPEVSIKPTYKYRKPWLCPNLLKCIIKKMNYIKITYKIQIPKQTIISL